MFPTTKFVLLQAPTAKVTFTDKTMPSWYDIKAFGSTYDSYLNAFGIDEIIQNTKRITAVIEEEVRALNGDSKRIVVAGYSQGCAMALNAGLQFDQTLGGIIGWAGFMFPTTEVNVANDRTPLLIANGLDDTTVPFVLADMSFERLRNQNNPVTKIEEKGMGHFINQNVVMKTTAFLKQVYNK